MRNNSYKNNKNIIGIILYGSATNRLNNNPADIDILVIKEKGEDYKGCNYIEKMRVEFFEKTLSSLIDEIDNLDVNLDRTLYSIFKTGVIIVNKNGTIDYLKDLIESKDEPLNRRKVIFKRLNTISHLLNIFKENKDNNLNEYIYYNLLDEIRKYYHERYGFSKISSHKVNRLYTNQEEAKRYCLFLPQESFRNLYIELINGYNEEKFNELLEITMINDFNEYDYELSGWRYSRSEIRYEVTIIDNILGKCINLYEEKDESFLSVYYLVLERIRRLYTGINAIDNIPCDLNNLDLMFLENFKKALDDPNPKELHRLFLKVIKGIKIDLRNYKIKC